LFLLRLRAPPSGRRDTFEAERICANAATCFGDKSRGP
jgi:hypothetical protein